MSVSHRLSFSGIVLRAGLIVLLLVVTGCATPASEPAGISVTERGSGVAVGVVDTQWLLKESKLGSQVNETLNQFRKDRQALLELEQQELRNLENELLRQGSVLSPSAKQQKEEQLRQRMLDYQQKAGNMSREFQTKQAELLDEFREQVDLVVKQIAQQRGLGLVVEKGKNTSTRYYDEGMDISSTVLDILDQTTLR
ncbi:MAG: OmpH family outer membrane protein [Nitrospira sp. SB0662_bin_26]|nr:OmpH family outer membrane protein [Nitrospira sp. SB0662_bin_26]